MLSKITIGLTTLVLCVACIFTYIQNTIWWAGFDLQNCLGCKPIIDWTDEVQRKISHQDVKTFQKNGVIVLQSVISPQKVANLTEEVESLSDTFMSTILTKIILKQYLKYEHKLDTRSELIRDWAIHGPLSTWAAQLMNVKSARLYNCEKIYSTGESCSTSWHRDTVAAPFSTNVKSVTINIYLDDIGADGPNGDALIYVPKSHLNLDNPPDIDNLYEPNLKVGDVLVHDPHVYHTPSGKGCWKRRSLQFRYVESPTTFTFEPNRFPHGPIPWTFAHSPGVAPHGLQQGDSLEGPWYPLVYPKTLDSEHIPIQGKPWSISNLLSISKKALDIAEQLGIGNENCTLDEAAKSHIPYFGFDGIVTSCDNWEMLSGLPVHKQGQIKNTINIK